MATRWKIGRWTLDVSARKLGPVAQRLEQGTHNSSLTSCASFHCFAQPCRRWVFSDSAFAVRYAELRAFAAENLQTVENDRRTPMSRSRAHLALDGDRAQKQ